MYTLTDSMYFPTTVIASMILGVSIVLVPVLGGTPPTSIPLTTVDGKEVILDFSSPTPSPTMTPTPTSTPSPTPTHTPTPTVTSTPTPTPLVYSSAQMDEWFTRYANHYSIDRSKLWNIAVCESGLRVNAVNWIYGGLFQFSPNTWESNRRLMGMDTSSDLRFNPEEAIRTGAFVLSTRGASAWPSCAK